MKLSLLLSKLKMCMDNNIGFFFDLDGTLIDNISVMTASYFAFVEGFGKKGSLDEFDRYNGVPIKLFLQDFISKYSLNENVSSLWEKYESKLLENYTTVKPRDGVVEVFSLLKEKCIPYAIVTSATSRIASCWVNAQLEKDIAPPVISCDEVKNTKPNPEPYIKAMSLLNCSSGFAVEDSLNGIKSATDAGLRVFFFQEERKNIFYHEVFETFSSFNRLGEFIESF